MTYAIVDVRLRSMLASANRAVDDVFLEAGIDPGGLSQSVWSDDLSDLEPIAPSTFPLDPTLPAPLDPPSPTAGGELGEDVLEGLVVSLDARSLEIGTMRRSADPSGSHRLGVHLDLVGNRLLYFVRALRAADLISQVMQDGHSYRIDVMLRDVASVTQETFAADASILHIQLASDCTLEYRWRPCLAMPFSIQRDFTEDLQCGRAHSSDADRAQGIAGPKASHPRRPQRTRYRRRLTRWPRHRDAQVHGHARSALRSA